MLDTVTSSATISTMAKNYSHCPLKKRPIQFKEEENFSPKLEKQAEPVAMVIDARKRARFPTPPPVKIEIPDINDEPENLCTKPEDLSRKRYSAVDSTTPSIKSVSVITSSYPPKINSPQEASAPVTVLSSSSSSSLTNHTVPSISGNIIGGGAFHRVVTNNDPMLSRRRSLSPEPLHYHAPTTWHRSISAASSTPPTITTSNPTPQYPPAYFPLGYPAYRHHNTTAANEIYHPYPLYPSPPSPYAPRDSSCSPPSHLSSIVQHQSQRLPLAPIALLPSESSAAAAILTRSSLPSNSSSRAASLSPTSPSSATSSIRSRSPLSTDLSPSPSIIRAASSNVSQFIERRSRSIQHTPTIISTNGSATNTSSTTMTTSANGAARHQCPDCGKSYSTFSGLSKHRQFHCAASGDGPRKSFSCKYCEKIYVSLGALKMHIRTHTLPCKCTLCGKAFSRPWLLQGHIRTHTGEKPFSCQHCHRAFADRSNLRAHLQTHSDIKKYSCPTCSKTFSRMSLLTKHAEGGGCNTNNANSNGNNQIIMVNGHHGSSNTPNTIPASQSMVSATQMYTSIHQVKHHPELTPHHSIY